MGRIQSKKLHRFLKEHGALHNPREVKKLKHEWRRRYQNQWAREQRKNKKEIRFTITTDEYREVKAHCQTQSLTPTVLARELLLSQSKNTSFIPDREQLLEVAKNLGLAINRMNTRGADDPILKKLLQAETQLLNYLNP